jgi:hypothetical protein
MTLYTTSPGDEREAWNTLTDEDRDRAFAMMPNMLDGFMKLWGWLHFAKAIEAICREKNSARSTVQQVGTEMKVVAYANPVILLPADEGDAECEWTARVQGNQDDVFSLPLYASSQAAPNGEAFPDDLLQALDDLSFACFGGLGTQRPDTATYNRTFAVLEKYRNKRAAPANQDPKGDAS